MERGSATRSGFGAGGWRLTPNARGSRRRRRPRPRGVGVTGVGGGKDIRMYLAELARAPVMDEGRSVDRDPAAAVFAEVPGEEVGAEGPGVLNRSQPLREGRPVLQIDNVDFSGATMNDLHFSGTQLWRQGFAGANFSNASVVGSDLTYANLRGITVAGATSRRANLAFSDGHARRFALPRLGPHDGGDGRRSRVPALRLRAWAPPRGLRSTHR